MMFFFLSVARSHCLLFGTVLASQGWLSVSYCYRLAFLPHRSTAVEFAPFDGSIDIGGGGTQQEIDLLDITGNSASTTFTNHFSFRRA